MSLLEFWNGKRVLVTGHTGLKGAWVWRMLETLGAEVAGLALAPYGPTSLASVLGLGADSRSTIADLRDDTAVRAAIARHKPELVLHMAA